MKLFFAVLFFALTVATAASAQTVTVANSQALREAFDNAQPGTTIILEGGRYMTGELATPRAGRADARITLRARNANQAVLLGFGMSTCVRISHAFWTFQDLRVEVRDFTSVAYFLEPGGTDAQIFGGQIYLNSPYEHAIKGSGNRNAGPDRAHIRGVEMFSNPGVPNMNSNTTAVDFVSTDDVVFEDNYIHDLQKVGEPNSDGVSYGFFIKGNSKRAIVRNNVVTRIFIGLSAGGGGTDPQFFRGGDTAFEARDTLFVNNLVFDTNDVGLYLNKSSGTRAYHNTFWKNFTDCDAPNSCSTTGSSIDVRFQGSTLDAKNNILAKVIKNRDGGTNTATGNLLLPSNGDTTWFTNAAGGDFTLLSDAPAINRCTLLSGFEADAEGRARPVGTAADCGAFENPSPSANPRPYEGPDTVSVDGPDSEDGGEEDSDDGCGCSTAARSGSLLGLLVLATLFVVRRKRLPSTHPQ